MEFALPIERPEVPMLTETDERPFQRRSVHFKKDDFETYGYAPGCPGCISIQQGGPLRNHWALCRSRMMQGPWGQSE
eukprot:12349811-Karenia_brevis.AAC.1